MSGNKYQTLVVQRSLPNRAPGAKSPQGRKGKHTPVHVHLSQETAGTLQKMSEATRLPREVLAAEAIRRGIGTLNTFSTKL
jgi:hypothetical protein